MAEQSNTPESIAIRLDGLVAAMKLILHCCFEDETAHDALSALVDAMALAIEPLHIAEAA